MKGLAKLDAMPAGVALHIPKCWSVHTFTMRFPLDLIWLDKSGAVVRVDRDVAPRRIKTCIKARSVVEANAGTADAFVAAGRLAESDRGARRPPRRPRPRPRGPPRARAPAPPRRGWP